MAAEPRRRLPRRPKPAKVTQRRRRNRRSVFERIGLRLALGKRDKTNG
jgi:hypothetical protein